MIELSTPIATYVLQDGETAQDIPAPTCYLIAKNGLFMKTTQDMYSAVRKVDSIPGLAELKEETKASYPKVPLGLILTVTDFFKKVYAKHKSEAVVVLYYNRTKDKWYVDVPKQTVSGAAAKYSSDILKMDGFSRIGSIHSHADFQAFHSGTDDHDEKSFDGIHITIGHVNSDEQSYAIRLMCGEKSMKLDFIGSLSSAEYTYSSCPDAWLDNVSDYVAPTVSNTTYYPDSFHDRRFSDNMREDLGQYGRFINDKVQSSKRSRGVRRKSDKLTPEQQLMVEMSYGYPEGCY